MQIHSTLEFRRLISPANTTDNTAIVSQIIDLQDVHSCELVITTGSLADADATFTALVEDGNVSNLSDNATVAAGLLLGSTPSFIFSDDDKVFRCGYIGAKRYIRLTITPANNTGNAFISAVAVLQVAKCPSV